MNVNAKVYGGEGDDHITIGTAGLSSMIYTGEGNDVLHIDEFYRTNGLGRIDTFQLNEGDDVFEFSGNTDGQVTLINGVDNLIQGGEGVDTVRLTGSGNQTIEIKDFNSFERFDLTGNGDNTLVLSHDIFDTGPFVGQGSTANKEYKTFTGNKIIINGNEQDKVVNLTDLLSVDGIESHNAAFFGNAVNNAHFVDQNGDDVIYHTGGDTVTLKNGDTLDIVKNNGNSEFLKDGEKQENVNIYQKLDGSSASNQLDLYFDIDLTVQLENI